MRISAQDKLEIVKKALEKQTSIVKLARTHRVSRKAIYTWIKKYKIAGPRKKAAALDYRFSQGKTHPKFYRNKLKHLVLKLLTVDPSLSATSLGRKLKVGRHAIVTLLKELGLSRLTERQNFARLYNGPKRLHADIRGQIVRSVLEENQSVTDVCRKWHIARKTYYGFLKKYRTGHLESGFNQKKLNDNYRKGFKHPKSLSESTHQVVLSEVIKNPNLSIHALADVLKISSHGIWNVSKNYNLTNLGSRIAFSQAVSQKQPLSAWQLPDRIKSVFEAFTPQTAPALPPFDFTQDQPFDIPKIFLEQQIIPTAIPETTEGTPIRKLQLLIITLRFIFRAIKHIWSFPFTQRPIVAFSSAFSLPVITLFIFQGLITYLSIYMQTSFGTSVGYIFATLALLFGTFFFLYSMKYYLTIAMVLVFSRNIGSEEENQKSKINPSTGSGQNYNSKFKSDSANPTVQQYNNITVGGIPANRSRSGLIPDLSSITLSRHPFVSIHIPLYNEKRVVNRLLEAVTSMDYDNFEVIVADDSTDETKDIVLEWKNHPRIKISHRESRVGFKGGALAEAQKIMDPRTEFVIVFDADFLPYPDTIEQFLKYFQNSVGSLDHKEYSKSKIAALQGYQWHVLNKSENWITRGVRTEYAGSYVVERSGSEIFGGLKQIAGAVFMIRSDILERYKWQTSITEDFQLTLRLYRDGYTVVYTPYIQAPSECVSTLKRLIRQRMRWAEGHSFNIRRLFKQMLFGRWIYENSELSGQNSNDLQGNHHVILNSFQDPHNNQAALDNQEMPKVLNSFQDQHDKRGQLYFLPSKLSLAEKLEFLYLSPYYLQSAFFLLGTCFWFLAEAVFLVRLPFWTEIWGWSLIMTNMLALPLMNLVGLFLEEAEEKDYLGLFAFTLITYILTPFQAYASVKGFLENEEGPWFRTPKTGHITDVFKRGSFYR